VRFSRFAFVAIMSAGVWSPCVGQLANPRTRIDSVVRISELPMTRKGRQAFDKGTQLLLNGNAQGSLAYLRKAVDLAPFSYRPRHNLALAYYNLRQLDAAGENFQRSINFTGGKFAPSVFGLAMVLYRQSEYPGAERLVREGLLLQPDSAVGKYCLGLVQFSTGRIAEAERSAEEALTLDPGESDAYVLLAWVHEATRNHTAELKDAETYLKLAPSGALKADALELVRRARQALAAGLRPAN
jgi:tetratricopeptide (TPR) repeat protein